MRNFTKSAFTEYNNHDIVIVAKDKRIGNDPILMAKYLTICCTMLMTIENNIQRINI